MVFVPGGAHLTPPPPFRLRNNFNANGSSGAASRILTRTRAEDIPDIYWEQAARELDFCTCRKCQVQSSIAKGLFVSE